MESLEEKIVSALRNELDYQETSSDYAQWLQAVSFPRAIEKKDGQFLITVRVVVQTNESELVDGMDIAFTLEPLIDPDYYNNSPDYHGGSIEDSQAWLKHHGEVIYQQVSNPYGKERVRP